MEKKAISRHRRVGLWLVLLFLGLGYGISAVASDLVVSEIMYDVDGADTGKEWVEIYNLGPESVVVSSTWRFFDSTYHKINFYQGTSTVAANDFFILADQPEQFLEQYPDFSGNIFDTVVNLSNSSSSLALSFDEGASDGLTDYYDAQWGGSGSGFSLEKIDFFAKTAFNWQESFPLGGTPGQSNSQKTTEEPAAVEPPVTSEAISNWAALLINEFLPNPIGSDNTEWIELYNSESQTIDITGLKIKDSSSRVFVVEADSELPLILEGYSYLLLPKSLTGLSLNNTQGDGVFIFDPEGNILDQVSYADTALEGRSYVRDKQQFFWTKTPTPAAANQISVNQPPVAQIQVEATDFLIGEKIVFSAEQSYDPESEELDYLWQLADGQTSTRESIKCSFDNGGSYTIRLTVTDIEGAIDTAEFVVDIYQTPDQTENLANAQPVADKNIVELDLAEDDLIISEFIPNPVGSDDSEWIEIYNASDQNIALMAWQIDDQAGGSRPWEFSSSTVIFAKDFLLLQRAETKLTLNNDQDTVRLLTPLGDVWQEINYEKIPEGQSYAFDNINKEWVITQPSARAANIFINDVSEEIIYNVSEIAEQETGQEVLVQGVAISDVSQDSASLYLADYNFLETNFQELVEIYSYYKNFPEIKAGQVVSVRGNISRLGDLPRVKIKSSEDVWLNDIKIDLPQPEIILTADLEADLLGAYVGVKGVVVKKSGQNIYLATDRGDDYQLRASSQALNKDLVINKGDEITVVGVLTELGGNFKLIPLGINNILSIQQVQGEKIIADDLSGTSSSSPIVTNQVNRQVTVRNILILAAIFLIICWGLYFLKRKKSGSSF